VPIPGEVEIEAATAFADVEHGSLDELIGMNEAPEAFRVARVLDAIGERGPKAEPLPPRLFLARKQLGRAGVVVGERIDPGKALPHEFLLEPQPAFSRNGVDLREKIAVPVGVASAEAELDRLVSRKSFERLLGLLDEGPRVLAAPAEAAPISSRSCRRRA